MRDGKKKSDAAFGQRKVVVTGIGLATPLGFNEPDIWQRLMDSQTAIGSIRSLDTTEYKARNGAEIPDELIVQCRNELNIPTKRDRTVDLAMAASARALLQSGLVTDPASPAPRDTATLVGSGTGVSHSVYETFKSYFEKGLRGLRPTSVPRGMANAISSQVSMHYKLTGPNYVTVSACSSSTNAIGLGYRMIKDGYADSALCIGADAPFDPFLYGAWNNLGVLSTNPEPEASCRPFDADRDGCVLGEGAAALILENSDNAQTRGAGIRAEIAGYGESSDAAHLTRPSPDGQARSIIAAMRSAGLDAEDIDYINAHGTATRANDPAEARSIRQALGDQADRIPVASNKSFIGHTLGASGAVETALTILTLENMISPPNLNLLNRDEECPLNLVSTRPRPFEGKVALKNSFGFGGNNAVLVIRKP
jgi:3-oxoacyl-[acyl-carrier-protein] synthase II